MGIKQTLSADIKRAYKSPYFYLTDTNPYHNIMVEIGRKAFLPGEYSTESERMDVLEPILNLAIEKNLARAFRLLNSNDSKAIQ